MLLLDDLRLLSKYLKTKMSLPIRQMKKPRYAYANRICKQYVDIERPYMMALMRQSTSRKDLENEVSEIVALLRQAKNNNNDDDDDVDAATIIATAKEELQHKTPSDGLINLWIRLLDVRMWMKRVKDNWTQDNGAEASLDSKEKTKEGMSTPTSAISANAEESKEETMIREEKHNEDDDDDDHMEDDDDDQEESNETPKIDSAWNPPVQLLPSLINTPETFDQHIEQVAQRAHFLLGLAPSADDSTLLEGKNRQKVTQLAEKWDSMLPQAVSASDHSSPASSPRNSPKNGAKSQQPHQQISNNGIDSDVKEDDNDARDQDQNYISISRKVEDGKNGKNGKDGKDGKDGNNKTSTAADVADLSDLSKIEIEEVAPAPIIDESDDASLLSHDVAHDFLKYLQTGKYAPPTILLTLLARRQRRAEERIHGLHCMTKALRSVTLPSVLADLVQWIRPSLRGVSAVERHLELCEAHHRYQNTTNNSRKNMVLHLDSF
jgi:hypothetical protein